MQNKGKYYGLARVKNIYLIINIYNLTFAYLRYYDYNKDIIDNAIFLESKAIKLREFYGSIYNNKKISEFFTTDFARCKDGYRFKICIRSNDSDFLNIIPIDTFLEGCEQDADLTVLLLLYGIDILYNHPIRDLQKFEIQIIDTWLPLPLNI